MLQSDKWIHAYAVTDSTNKIGYAWLTYANMHNGHNPYEFLQGIVVSKLKKLHEFEVYLTGGFAGIIEDNLPEIESHIQQLQIKLLTHV